MSELPFTRTLEIRRKGRYRRLHAIIDRSAEGPTRGDPETKPPVRVSLEVNALAGWEVYAALVVERVPLQRGSETVQIRLKAEQQEFTPTLTPVGDGVEEGLPEEYAGPVVEALSRYLQREGAPGGCGLRVTSAAHAWMGSNAVIFSRVAWTAAAILATPAVELTDDYFDRILDELLKPLPA